MDVTVCDVCQIELAGLPETWGLKASIQVVPVCVRDLASAASRQAGLYETWATSPVPCTAGWQACL